MIDSIINVTIDITSTHFFSLGIVMLLAVMSPGPDFAIVTKNTLTHSRRAGIFTALGISCAICVHMAYCIFGLAAVIRESALFFHIIQYVGSTYLAYLGIMLLSKAHSTCPQSSLDLKTSFKKTDLSAGVAFKEGFICNLLNPKATLFFLTLFSVITSAQLSFWMSLGYAIEIILITIIWFSLLSFLLSHAAIAPFLDKAKTGIEKILGVCLIVMAVAIFALS